jgi:hypothetical protein
MFDSQTGVAALAAVFAIVLFLVLPSVLIEAHTGRRTWLSRGDRITVPRSPRRSLFVELPFVVVLLAASQFIMVAAVISPISGLVTRAIGALEVIAFISWMIYLLGTFRRHRPRGDQALRSH